MRAYRAAIVVHEAFGGHAPLFTAVDESRMLADAKSVTSTDFASTVLLFAVTQQEVRDLFHSYKFKIHNTLHSQWTTWAQGIYTAYMLQHKRYHRYETLWNPNEFKRPKLSGDFQKQLKRALTPQGSTPRDRDAVVPFLTACLVKIKRRLLRSVIYGDV